MPTGLAVKAAAAQVSGATQVHYRGRYGGDRSRYYWRGDRGRHWGWDRGRHRGLARGRHWGWGYGGRRHYSCWQLRRVWTPYGFAVQRVWVCR